MAQLVGWIVNSASVVVRTPVNYAMQQSLDTLSSDARACACVANVCYDHPRPNVIQTCYGAPLDLDTDFNEPLFCLYVNRATGDPILGFTGTRGPADWIQYNMGVIWVESNNIANEMWIYEQVSRAAEKYSRARLFITGHSLGGTRGLVACVGGNDCQPEMRISHLIHEAHLFNPGSGLNPGPSAARGVQPGPLTVFLGESGFFGGQRMHARVFVHRIFGDIVSVTNFPRRFGGRWTITTYSVHPRADNRHTILNFTLRP